MSLKDDAGAVANTPEMLFSLVGDQISAVLFSNKDGSIWLVNQDGWALKLICPDQKRPSFWREPPSEVEALVSSLRWDAKQELRRIQRMSSLSLIDECAQAKSREG